MKKLIRNIFIVFLFLQGTVITACCEVVHIGIASQVIPHASNDGVLAAIKAWAQHAVEAKGIQATFEVEILDSSAEIRNGLDEQRLEIINIPVNDLPYLDMSLDTVFVSLPAEISFPVRYVLVVHRDSGITKMSGLKNRRVTISRDNYMQLADLWFEASLQKQGHAASSSFLARITHSENASRAGLQVFFQQIDAAVIPKDAVDKMASLNPQIKKDLLIIEESEPFMPVILAVRPSWKSPLRHAMENILVNLHTTILGKQILTVFHCLRLEQHPITILEPTLSFLQNNKNVTKSNGGNK
ncbi:MAG: hypothetical protein CR981_02280 [Proteobacteria bacterium]|nr:MAG: hypothetical protein CR981_02280 [Pseudomonadota bacterium]